MVFKFYKKTLKVGLFFIFWDIGFHNLFYFIGNSLYFLSWSWSLSRNNYIHIDFTSIWVCSCLLYGNFHQINGFLDIILGDNLRKFHFSKCLTESYKWLKLTRSGRDSFCACAHFSHFSIGFNQFIPCLRWEHRAYVFSCISDILSEKLFWINYFSKI